MLSIAKAPRLGWGRSARSSTTVEAAVVAVALATVAMVMGGPVRWPDLSDSLSSTGIYSVLQRCDVLVPTALAISAASDLASRRIPNVLVLTTGLLGLVVSAGTHQLLSGIAAALLCLCVTVPVWRRGLVGGGDVKFLAAAAAWVRLDHLFAFGIAVALLGGLLSVLVLLGASSRERRLVRANATASLATARLTVARSAGTSVPYGIAIAAGAVVVMSGALP